MIENTKQLAKYLDCQTPEHISRQLYKETECGIGCSIENDRITLAGYCEGTDADCPAIVLVFPFSGEAFEAAVDQADRDGLELWNATHGCDDCGLDGAINPDCPTCKGEGTVI